MKISNLRVIKRLNLAKIMKSNVKGYLYEGFHTLYLKADYLKADKQVFYWSLLIFILVSQTIYAQKNSKRIHINTSKDQSLGWQRVTTKEYLPHEVMGTGGIVTADNAMASHAGVEILRQGGDAVDAAVTTALVLGVVQPFASGIGGGGFALLYRTQTHKAHAVDFREIAPGEAHKNMFLDPQSTVIKNLSTIGALAAGVPGEIAGLYYMHQKYGKLPWKQIVAPALKLARDGFPMHALLHEYCTLYKDRVVQVPLLKKILIDLKGSPYPLGTQLKFPQLAQTLDSIAQHGAKGFYQGKVADELIASVQKAGGIMSLQDLAEYRVKERAVLTAFYAGYTLYSMPPPSSGGLVIMQALKVLEQSRFHALDHNSSTYLHRLIETLKHGFADRANHMGDPDFYPIPIQKLLSSKRIQEILKHYKPNQTQSIQSYGIQYQATRDGGTSHFNVLDKNGNAVALTTTINTTFASQFIAGSTGILLNNEMDDFVTKPGAANAYGLIGHQSNEVQAKKRPLSSMSPTLILQQDQIKGMVGGSGGPTIITGTLQVLLNLIHGDGEAGYVGRAVAQPRIHHQWTPNTLMYDKELHMKELSNLRFYGHKIKPWPIRLTAIQALWVKGEMMMGASDPSKRGKPSVLKSLVK
jgi:gamma-glutamyltranspeptidase / glutathione hydrolase